MRKYFMTAFVLAAMLVFATSGLALEKTAVRADRTVDNGGWDAGATCTVAYANICTGWLYSWSGWSPSDIVGVIFDPDCCAPDGGALTVATAYFWTGAPAGYGFTGTLSVTDVVAGCPGGTTYASALVVPPLLGGPVNIAAAAPAGSAALVYQFGVGLANPSTVPTDHPGAGPTGPTACGTCYPTTRPTHSFYFGTPTSPLCPGSGFDDGTCNAELLFWSAAFTCGGVSVDETSWGAVKNLYR